MLTALKETTFLSMTKMINIGEDNKRLSIRLVARGKRRDLDMCASGVKLVIKKKKKFTKFSKNKSCKVRMILTSVIRL